MAEYYDFTNDTYYGLLKRSVKVYKWKMELLDYQDATLREIVIGIDSSNAGSINVTSEQGTCRSCTMTFANPGHIYSLVENNPFWNMRRFKLYIGIEGDEDTFWFSKGVYIIQKADINYYTVNIQAVDKYGLLDGTLNISPAFLKTTFEVGAKVGDVVRQILLQDIGNGLLLDATEPIIDPDIAHAVLYKEFELGIGSYYGSFFEEIMTSFGCDIYYDNFGRLVINRTFNDDLPYWCSHIGASYTFSDKEVNYQDPSDDYAFDGFNYVTVDTDNEDTANESYTAINHNPQSPVCVEKVGYKPYDNGNPITISTGDHTIDTPARKCREYAEYVLLQNTCNTITKSFNSPILPHLDTRQVIRVSDDSMAEDGAMFYVSSLTFPFGSANDMSITATNVKWLMTDTESTSLTSEVGSRSVPKYEVSFGGTVYNTNGQSFSFTAKEDYEGGAVILPSSGKKVSAYPNLDFGYFNGTNLFGGWQDNQYGDTHRSGSLYTIPAQNVQMTPIWSTQQTAKIKSNHASDGTYKMFTLVSPSATNVPEVAYFKTVGKYSSQRVNGTNTLYSYTGTVGAAEVDFLYPTDYNFDLGGLGGATWQQDGEITEVDLTGLTAVTSMALTMGGLGSANNLETLKLPPNVTSINCGGSNAVCIMPKLSTLVWPTGNCTISNISMFMYNLGTSTTPVNELTVPNNLKVVMSGGMAFYDCNMAKKLIVNCDIESTNGITCGVGSVVEELDLLGDIDVGSFYYANQANVKKVVIGADVSIVTVPSLANGANAKMDVVYNSTKQQSISGSFNGYAGTSIVFADNTVKTLSSSLSGASNLATFAFPAGLETLQYCFSGGGLTSAALPSSIKSIDGSFGGLSGLTTVSIASGGSNCEIADSFNGCPITSLTLSDTVKTIDSSFNSTQITSVTIPDSVTYCKGFEGGVLTTVSIGAGVTNRDMFSYKMTALSNITISENNATYKAVNNYVYNKSGTTLYFAPMTETSVTVPDGVTSLAQYSLYQASLTSLSLPSTLTSTGMGAMKSTATIGTLEILNTSLSATNINNLLNSGSVSVTKIRGYAGSTAETYATDHNITFETIT